MIRKTVSTIVAAMVLMVGSSIWTQAQTPGDQSGQPMIAKIMDLIADFGESQWTVVTESGSVYGDAIGGVDRVRKAVTKGYFTSGRQ